MRYGPLMRYGHELLEARREFRRCQSMVRFLEFRRCQNVVRFLATPRQCDALRFWRQQRWNAWVVLRRELTRL